MNKQIGCIGLGKMGYNMSLLLMEKGWNVVGYNRSSEPIDRLAGEGATPAKSIQELVDALDSPRLVWLMVPHQAVDSVLKELTPLLDEGDVVIDGGNSPYTESIRRGKELSEKGIGFMDVGVSGGPLGARTGACCMIGGDKELFDKHETLFRDISLDHGYAYLGPSGAGHYVKMVHNGIEYGMMQALAEGFDVLKNSDQFDLDLPAIADLYNHGSVITSRLVGWLDQGFEQFGTELDKVSGSAAHSGEGLWTVEEAKRLGIDAGVIKGALEVREESQNSPSYQGKLIMAMRYGFGRHDVGDSSINA